MVTKYIIDSAFKGGITEDGHCNFTPELYQVVEALVGAIKSGDEDYQYYIVNNWLGTPEED